MPVETGLPFTSAVKKKPRRRAAMMDMARGRACLLQAPCTGLHDPATTVGCHGNWSDMGKGERRKADDCYVVFGCFECHCWLDQSGAKGEEKRAVFLRAMIRMRELLEHITTSRKEPNRFRRAARWAIDCIDEDGFDPRMELLALTASACP